MTTTSKKPPCTSTNKLHKWNILGSNNNTITEELCEFCSMGRSTFMKDAMVTQTYVIADNA